MEGTPRYLLLKRGGESPAYADCALCVSAIVFLAQQLGSRPKELFHSYTRNNHWESLVRKWSWDWNPIVASHTWGMFQNHAEIATSMDRFFHPTQNPALGFVWPHTSCFLGSLRCLFLFAAISFHLGCLWGLHMGKSSQLGGAIFLPLFALQNIGTQQTPICRLPLPSHLGLHVTFICLRICLLLPCWCSRESISLETCTVFPGEKQTQVGMSILLVGLVAQGIWEQPRFVSLEERRLLHAGHIFRAVPGEKANASRYVGFLVGLVVATKPHKVFDF